MRLVKLQYVCRRGPESFPPTYTAHILGSVFGNQSVTDNITVHPAHGERLLEKKTTIYTAACDTRDRIPGTDPQIIYIGPTFTSWEENLTYQHVIREFGLFQIPTGLSIRDAKDK